MQRAIFLLLLLSLCRASMAQKQYIRTNSNSYFGQNIRTAPTRDGGWLIFSTDSLKLLRYDHCSQPQFRNQYFLPNDVSASNSIVPLLNNGCAILTQKISGTFMAPVITCLDSSGNVLWSKSFGNDSLSEFGCSISADSIGYIYLSSNTTTISVPANVLTKIDYNGNISYETLISRGNNSADAISTTDNGVLFRSGNCFIKFDVSGNISWATSIAPTGSVMTRPVETGNGYIFSCNVNITGAISLMKIGRNGNLVFQKRTDFMGKAPDLIMRKDRTICGLFARNVNGIDFPTMIDMDSNLTILSQRSNSFNGSNTTLKAQDLTILNDNTPLFAGVTNPTGSLFVGRTDESFNTGCDTIFQPIQTSREVATQIPETLSTSSYSHAVTNLVTSQSQFSDSLMLLCSVPDQISIGGDTLICGPHPAFLFNIANSIFDKFLWSTGDTTEIITVDMPEQYWLMGIGRCGLDTLRDTIDIIKRQLVKPELGPDKFRCEDNTVHLTGPDCDHCAYLWNDGSHGQTMDVHTYGNQWLRVTNDGCISTDTILISSAKCECKFFVPNTITPNHDGINDVLKPVYFCDLKDYTMRIFNRWGEMVYMTDDVEQAWDARMYNIPVPQDVYVYVITFMSLMEGAEYQQVTKTGSLGVVY